MTQQLTVPIPDFVKGEIYMITCDVNEKLYIGQTKTHGYKSHRNKWYPKGYRIRFEEHIQRASDDIQGDIYAAMRLYGTDHFSIELLHTCELDELNDWETFYVMWFDTYRNGYNLTEGGAYTPKGVLNVGVASAANKEKSDIIRTEFLKDNSDKITKVLIDDATTGFHSVVAWIYINTQKDPIRWDYSDFQTNIWSCFKRSYSLIKNFVPDDKISVSLRLVYYLVDFENSEYAHLLRLMPVIKSPREISTGNVENRYKKLKDLQITNIVLKLYHGTGNYRISVCINSPDSNREIVSEFGGASIDIRSSVKSALKLAEMLTIKDKISMIPDLAAFLRINKIEIPWNPVITRKPRTVKKEE